MTVRGSMETEERIGVARSVHDALTAAGYNNLPIVLDRGSFDRYNGETIHGFHGTIARPGPNLLLLPEERQQYGDFFERTTDSSHGTILYRGKRGTGFPADLAMRSLRSAPPDRHYIGIGMYGNGISFGPRELAMRYASHTVDRNGFHRHDPEVVAAVVAGRDLLTPRRALVMAKLAAGSTIVARVPDRFPYPCIQDIAGDGAGDLLLLAVANGIDAMVNNDHDLLVFNRSRIVVSEIDTTGCAAGVECVGRYTSNDRGGSNG